MPTTSNGWPFSITVRPSIGSPPNARRQSASLRITRRCWPSRASSAVNERPTAGITPRASKKPGETKAASTRSAPPSARRFASHPSIAIISARPPRPCACQSRRLAGATVSRSIPPRWGSVSDTRTRRPALGKSNALRISASRKLKMIPFAASPIASVPTINRLVPGVFASERIAKRTSCSSWDIVTSRGWPRCRNARAWRRVPESCRQGVSAPRS